MSKTAENESRNLWTLYGKFLKRLGPVVPIASWACFLVPQIANGLTLVYFYLAFIVVCAAVCLWLPRTMDKKIQSGLYSEGSSQHWWKQLGLYIDAFFIGLIAFSLLGMMTILLFKVPAQPLADVLLSRRMMNQPTLLITIISVWLSILRYQQKSASLEIKCAAYQFNMGACALSKLNEVYRKICKNEHKIIRMTSDFIVILYNLFFVGGSLAMVFFSQQIAMVIQSHFILKMMGFSTLMTTKIAIENEKSKDIYLIRKIEKISGAQWQASTSEFVYADESASNHIG